ncbi:hypothetical protein [Paenibacillus durus]|uniref:Uncharacterized protein n=1 Tax=Paenibacillus durus ATCC 35681 TaxID=1333534 RepID=A0A0F7CJV1_PAEDU|nr:hypothetical protein VK70_20115 [Paenibacillus durus ATCC 35681]
MAHLHINHGNAMSKQKFEMIFGNEDISGTDEDLMGQLGCQNSGCAGLAAAESIEYVHEKERRSSNPNVSPFRV